MKPLLCALAVGLSSVGGSAALSAPSSDCKFVSTEDDSLSGHFSREEFEADLLLRRAGSGGTITRMWCPPGGNCVTIEPTADGIPAGHIFLSIASGVSWRLADEVHEGNTWRLYIFDRDEGLVSEHTWTKCE